LQAAPSDTIKLTVTGHSNPPTEELKSVVEAFKQAKLQCQQQQNVCNDVTNIQSRRAKQSSTGTACQQQQPALPHGLEYLLEMCQAGISKQYIIHLLQDNFQGDVQVRQEVPATPQEIRSCTQL
jgi:hypothetical protein